MIRIARYFYPTVFTTVLVLLGYFWVREEVTTRIYRDKLDALAADYSVLANQYNDAVRQTAITELEVTEDRLNILIRTGNGEVKRIPTQFDPAGEIYVDFLVGNGRIWIRRVFDSQTPPDQALVIDPVWQAVDWERTDLNYGKAIYRALQPGIWSIQVNGSGSLSLEQVAASQAYRLQASPDIRSYEEIKLSLDREVQQISLKDLFDFCLSPFQN